MLHRSVRAGVHASAYIVRACSNPCLWSRAQPDALPEQNVHPELAALANSTSVSRESQAALVNAFCLKDGNQFCVQRVFNAQSQVRRRPPSVCAVYLCVHLV